MLSWTVIFSPTIIKLIIQQGRTLGFNYHTYILGEININSRSLDDQEALDAIMLGYDDCQMYCITAALEDTFFNLHFINENGRLLIMFHGFSIIWSKKYFGAIEDIDIQRYAHVMLELVNNFKILTMEISQD